MKSNNKGRPKCLGPKPKRRTPAQCRRARINRTFLGIPCRKMRPTQKHSPALWECMLGTVYALSPEGECKYFDYDYEAARVFAGLDTSHDNRLFRVNFDLRHSYVKRGCIDANPRTGKLVLWTTR